MWLKSKWKKFSKPQSASGLRVERKVEKLLHNMLDKIRLMTVVDLGDPANAYRSYHSLSGHTLLHFHDSNTRQMPLKLTKNVRCSCQKIDRIRQSN